LPETRSITRSLPRVIGISGLTLLAINQIVGSGIFGLPGLAAQLIGPAALLAYLIVTVLMLLVGLCFAEVGSRVAGAGGLYAYAHAAFGPVVGGVAGTLIWAAVSAVPSAAVANLMVDTLAASEPAAAAPIPRAMILMGVYAVLAAVNIRGARHGSRLSGLLCLIKLLPLVALVVLGLFSIHGPNLHWSGTPPAAKLGEACVLVFFAFMGTEGALTASGEVINPARTVPLAIVFALTTVAFLYIGLQLVAQGVLGADLAGAKSPLVAVALVVWGPWGRLGMVAAILLSVGGFLASDLVSSPRILHALADRGQLPKVFAAVHGKFGTPAVAILSYAFLCTLIACTGSFRQLVIVGSSGTLLLYLICCLGLIRLRARNITMDGAPFRAPGGWFVPLAAVLIIVWMLSMLRWQELAAAFGILAVSGIAYSVQQRLARPPRESRPPCSSDSSRSRSG
jgi:basic amino acid/polyamine antiporter, APA family